MLLALLAVSAGCRKSAKPPEPHAPKPIPSEAPTPAAEKVASEEKDPSWLAGTWQKEGEPRWFLFNLPSEVAELAGKPARVVRRGRMVIHGRFISAIFPDGEVELQATKDYAQLSASSGGVYRRGSPP